jgi:hypothetical protein
MITTTNWKMPVAEVLYKGAKAELDRISRVSSQAANSERPLALNAAGCTPG